MCKNVVDIKKLSLKYQNTSEIVKDFIVENNKHFPKLEEHFKRNAQVYQYIYAMLFLKYFCKVDYYGVKSKVIFDIAYRGYKMSKKISFYLWNANKARGQGN